MIKKEQYISLFSEWSKLMDLLYGKNTPERHDATSWDSNPSLWMLEYDEGIYNAWCEFDVGGPFWDKDLNIEEVVSCCVCGGDCDMNTEYEGSAICKDKNCSVHKEE